MPYCNPVLFKRSLIALAIVSMSACSTTPRIEDYDLSRIGEGILSAGRTTADVSQRAWGKTSYLLGFSDVEPIGDNDLLMDEVDLALLEEDAVLPGQKATARPVIIQTATAIPLDLTPVSQDQPILEIASAALPVEEVIAFEDLVHEVTSNETLWDIAKETTGDANNWHVLADVNNLAPDANVFPGQQLIIPADMVKPGYDDAVSATQTAALVIDTQDTLSGVNSDERLAIPTESTQATSTAESLMPEGRAFELNAGETLWDFAKRTTGDATNWQAIAGQNKFTEKQALVVRAGQTIYVPAALVKPELDVALTDVAPTDVAPTEVAPIDVGATNLATTVIESPAMLNVEAVATAIAEAIQPTDSDAISASTELLAEASALDETQPIKIVEATFKANDTLTAITLPQATATAAIPAVLDSASKPEHIMVSGTYYPKAVYNDADFSSSLLMRVSPGTTLQVAKAYGNWFLVETDKGLGYVHQRDIK